MFGATSLEFDFLSPSRPVTWTRWRDLNVIQVKLGGKLSGKIITINLE